LSIYTRNARLLSAQAEQGKYLDIEVK
jgi:hypothetical protein